MVKCCHLLVCSIVFFQDAPFSPSLADTLALQKLGILLAVCPEEDHAGCWSTSNTANLGYLPKNRVDFHRIPLIDPKIRFSTRASLGDLRPALPKDERFVMSTSWQVLRCLDVTSILSEERQEGMTAFRAGLADTCIQVYDM